MFFPAGVLAGIIGVALWPLHFAGAVELYPGQSHARIMACELFGAFIVGFLGTAMPRMLSARRLQTSQVLTLLLMHAAMIVAFALGNIFLGDAVFLLMLATFVGLMASHYSYGAILWIAGVLLWAVYVLPKVLVADEE